MAHAATVGLLYPGHAAEDDYGALEESLSGAVRLPLVNTSVGEDAHRIDALLDLGRPDRLAEGALALAEYRPDSLIWACTSGSFVFGWDGACQQADALGAVLGVPASSTSIGFVNAAAAMRLTTVAVAASYPAEVAESFVQFLGKGGVEVSAWTSLGIVSAAEVGRVDRDEVLALAAGIDTTGADGLLIPDTALHTLDWLVELEAAAGVPVLTANQVTVWEGLRLLGPVRPIEGRGSLFARR